MLAAVRTAVIGCGRWGRNYLRVMRQIEGCELVACCDPDRARMREIKDALAGVEQYRDFREMIGRTGPDAVVIATPAVSHYSVAEFALKAGVDCLVEKPLTVSSIQAEKLVTLAARRRRVLMVGHILLFHRAFENMKARLKRGEMGALRCMHAIRTNFGPVRKDVNVLWDLGSHDISMLMTLAGDEPAEVTGSGQSYMRRGIQDVSFGTIYFRRHKVVGHIYSSWIDPNKMRRLTVVGSRQMAAFDDVNPQEPLRIFRRGVMREKQYGDFGQFQLVLRDGDIEIPHIRMEEPLRLECSHFVDCVRRRRVPRSDGMHGLKVVRVLESLDASSLRRGRPVKIR